jgi:hypothetical protein
LAAGEVKELGLFFGKCKWLPYPGLWHTPTSVSFRFLGFFRRINTVLGVSESKTLAYLMFDEPKDPQYGHQDQFSIKNISSLARSLPKLRV